MTFNVASRPAVQPKKQVSPHPYWQRFLTRLRLLLSSAERVPCDLEHMFFWICTNTANNQIRTSQFKIVVLLILLFRISTIIVCSHRMLNILIVLYENSSNAWWLTTRGGEVARRFF